MTGMPRLSGAVMAHPRRFTAASRLAALDPMRTLRVVLDPEPDGPPTAVRTAMLAWAGVESGATHHLVLQDDVQLADGFFDHVRQAAVALPDAAIAFYANWNSRNGAAVRMGSLAGARWVGALNEYAPCVALMLPATVAEGFPRYARTEGGGWPYDVLMHRYLKAHGVPVRIAVPNPVEHSELPSIAGNATHGLRRSACFTGTAPDADTGAYFDATVVPYFKHGTAQCAVRHGSRWEHLETGRYLRRSGISLSACRDPFDAVRREDWPAAAWEVWLTALAMGSALRDGPAPDGSLDEALDRSLATIAPGGLCDELDAYELDTLVGPMRDLAAAGLAAGRESVPRPARAIHRDTPGRTVVVGGAGPFADHLTRLLADLGHDIVVADAGADITGAKYLVHLGAFAADPPVHGLADLLAAAADAGVQRVVYVSTSLVYAESVDDTVDEQTPVKLPATAPGWPAWQGEEVCRDRRETDGLPVHVLRFAPPVGPYAPTDPVVADWVTRAWTRRELVLSPDRAHQLVDVRDMAAAIDATLRGDPRSPTYNIASATLTEAELADVIRRVVRPTPQRTQEPPGEPGNPMMALDLAERELGWRASSSIDEGIRAYAQWLAYDADGSGA